ncbi:MAG: endonuclease III [Burkholderiales bacterium]|nr:endonuclease III [Anaerolineae bacterium]
MKRESKPAQNVPSIDVLRSKALIVYERLTDLYGERPLIPRREPMHELISTILSQRTNHRNESAAYRRMWERFKSWEGIRDASVKELTEAIAPSNYAETKAPNIQKTLGRIIEERGETSIEFLRDLPADEGLSWLMSLPSVGIKTASLVLLFCFNKSVLPVDVHVHRVSQRVGLIGPKVTPATAHEDLLAILPSEPYWLYNFHIALLRHGQQTCVWSNPRCERCPLTDICEWYQQNKAKDISK